MKKFKSLKLMLLGVLAMGSMNAFADDGYNKLFKFTYSGNDATITGFNTDLTDADKADVVIPAQVTDVVTGAKKNVVAIAEKAFADGKVKSISFTSANLTSIGKDAFKGSQITSLDLSKTKVTTIRNWFGTGYAFIKPSGTKYSAKDADDANKKIYSTYGVTPVKKDDPKTTGSEATFSGNDEINEYYKSINKNAKAVGDNMPYTKISANQYNVSTWPGDCQKAGMPIYWTVEEMNAYNATLEGALQAGHELTAIEAIAFNSQTGLTKAAGDVITEADANAYNATLPGNMDVTDLTQQKKDEDGNWLEYDDDSAYQYNIDNFYGKAGYEGLALVGNDTGTKFTSHLVAKQYNEEYVIAKKDWKNIGDLDPRTEAKYKSDEEAHAANITALLTAAAAVGDVLTPMAEINDGNDYVTTTTSYNDTPVNGAGTNTKLESVVLNAYWTSIEDGAFEACEALKSINFGKAANTVSLQRIGNKALLGSKLTDLNFVGTKVEQIPSETFVYANDPCKGNKEVKPLAPTSNNTLKSVEFNKVWYTINPYTFQNCKALATVTFEEREIKDESAPGSPATYVDPFDGIGTYAFGYTAIAEIEIPVALDATATASAIDADAFIGCTKLKSFTYMVDNETEIDAIKEVVDPLAFTGCSGVIYWTTNANFAHYNTPDPKIAYPKNSTMRIKANSGFETEFEVKPYANNPSKFYVKYYASTPIKVKKSEATVYNAYLGGTGADATLNMAKYKAVGGYYYIGVGDVVLILTGNKDLQFEAGDYTVGSWTYNPGSSSMIDPDSYEYGSGDNALNIVTDKDGISLAELDSEAGAERVVYGWVSSATKGTGWMKITSGDIFPQRSLYIFAVDEEDGSRLTVNWLDEDGNIEAQTTGINSIFGGADAADSKAIFNLQGVQVKGAQKGMFIQNGKKYVK